MDADHPHRFDGQDSLNSTRRPTRAKIHKHGGINRSKISIALERCQFAARAHRQQIRKDRETPYVAHPFRVCLIARQVFGIDDPKVLMAALLHDAIEDTTTDRDDLIEHFGTMSPAGSPLFPRTSGFRTKSAKPLTCERLPRDQFP